jgi:hypothetical protein
MSMSKLNLLFITRKSIHALHALPPFLRELKKFTNLVVWQEPGNIHQIIRKLPRKPHFIILHDHGAKCPRITGLTTLSIPYAAYLVDLHERTEDIRRALQRDKVPYIFSVVRDTFHKWFPEFTDKMRWLPHYIDPIVFKDYGLTKDIDYLLMGKAYPFRAKIIETMKKKPNFVYHSHPGYHFTSATRKRVFVGEKYARELNRAKIFFTCNTAYNYPVRKYYEALACNTLLLAPCSEEIIDLGFIPGVHFVEIDEHNFERKAEYYLQHETERKEIAERGYRMVHEKHTVGVRAAQMVEMIKDILAHHKPRVLSPSVKKRKRVESFLARTKRLRALQLRALRLRALRKRKTWRIRKRTLQKRRRK